MRAYTNGDKPSRCISALSRLCSGFGVVSSSLLDKLKEGGKPARQPDGGLVQKKKQQKPPAITYDDGKSVDPRRAARYLEDKLPKRDRILVFDGGHALMVAVQTLTSSGADNWSTGADFGAVGQGLAVALGECFARPGKRITHVTPDAASMCASTVMSSCPSAGRLPSIWKIPASRKRASKQTQPHSLTTQLGCIIGDGAVE
jgi:thiamine pyrophosphate-dependent acetolactate synthase large subunit-like protein